MRGGEGGGGVFESTVIKEKTGRKQEERRRQAGNTLAPRGEREMAARTAGSERREDNTREGGGRGAD